MARIFRDQSEERSTRPGRLPTESGRISANVVCNLWISDGEDGGKRIHFGLANLLVFTCIETERVASELLAMMSMPRLLRRVMVAR